MKNESQNIEYKESWRDEYLKWICGFANAQGGIIYIGVDDQKNVVGLENSKKLMEDIPNKVRDVLGIVVDVNLLSEDDREYISIEVKESSMPLTYRGKYYYRSGSTLQELGGVALNDFLMHKMNVTWDAATEPAAKIDDIDPEAIKYFLNAAIREGRISESARNDSIEQLLRRLHLINEENGHITLAALLLFGKDVERWNMTVAFRIGRFGASQADLITQDRIVCPLIMMPDRVVETLRSKYLVAPIHYEGMQRREPLEIPEGGLREMICNAIIHKDYTDTFIQMKVFDDYITLWNGGVLPPNYSVEKLMQPHESHPRNRLMANVFYLAGFIEAWGRGYEKISDAFKAENLEIPIFEEVRGGFMATIKREKFVAIQKGQNVTSRVTSNVTSSVTSRVSSSVTSRVSSSVGSMSVVQLSDRQKKICELIKENPFVSGEQMSVVLSVVPRTIWRDLAGMQKMGVLLREGNTSAGHWVLLIDKTE